MTRLLTLAVVLLAAALLGASGGSAADSQAPKLFGTVGPGFSIGLRDAQGNRVAKVDLRTYSVEIEDLSNEHNFRLTGPGVSESTQIEFIGKTTWTVTFRDGVYRYICDPHSPMMNGTFTAGSPPTTTPPPSSGAITAKTRLALTSGPGFVITLKTSAGKAVKKMKRGTYTVVVRDGSRIHNAHVVAPGVNRKTDPLTLTGTRTWKVKLGRTGTLRFLCDRHASAGMKGSAKIVS